MSLVIDFSSGLYGSLYKVEAHAGKRQVTHITDLVF